MKIQKRRIRPLSNNKKQQKKLRQKVRLKSQLRSQRLQYLERIHCLPSQLLASKRIK
jgi:hypothetical protein